MSNSRRRSRELALQGLYQWRLSGADAATIAKQLAETRGFEQADGEYFTVLLKGTIAAAEGLEAALTPLLDRPCAELSPIERGILMMAAYELEHQPEVPYRVVINEAVELAKRFGGTDGHKYVNGVIDKLAAEKRPLEVARRSAGHA